MKIKKISGIIVLLLAASFQLFASEYKGKRLLVEIMIYSGRENPTYYITDTEEIKSIVKMFQKKTRNRSFQKESVIPSRLGYQGVIIYNIDGITELPETVIIYDNNIQEVVKSNSRSGFTSTFSMDNTEKMETLLIDMAFTQKVIDSQNRKIIKLESGK